MPDPNLIFNSIKFVFLEKMSTVNQHKPTSFRRFDDELRQLRAKLRTLDHIYRIPRTEDSREAMNKCCCFNRQKIIGVSTYLNTYNKSGLKRAASKL